MLLPICCCLNFLNWRNIYIKFPERCLRRHMLCKSTTNENDNENKIFQFILVYSIFIQLNSLPYSNFSLTQNFFQFVVSTSISNFEKSIFSYFGYLLYLIRKNIPSALPFLLNINLSVTTCML